MYSLVYTSNSLAVLDNVCPDDVIRDIRKVFRDDKFELTNVRKEYLVDNSNSPLRGSSLMFDCAYTLETSNPLAGFANVVFQISCNFANIIGTASVDWKSFSATPWIYSNGSGFTPHVDGDVGFSGGFVFWCHEEWNTTWGGHLVVFENSVEEFAALNSWKHPPHLLKESITRREKILQNVGLGTLVIPKPNRLVFLSPKVPHMVTTIEKEKVERLSLVGFFNRAYACQVLN